MGGDMMDLWGFVSIGIAALLMLASLSIAKE